MEKKEIHNLKIGQLIKFIIYEFDNKPYSLYKQKEYIPKILQLKIIGINYDNFEVALFVPEYFAYLTNSNGYYMLITNTVINKYYLQKCYYNHKYLSIPFQNITEIVAKCERCKLNEF